MNSSCWYHCKPRMQGHLWHHRLIWNGSKTLAVSGIGKGINQIPNKFLLRPSSNVPRCSSLRNSLHCKMLRGWVDYAEKAWASQSVLQPSHAEEMSFYTHLHCAGTFVLGGNYSCLFSAPIHIAHFMTIFGYGFVSSLRKKHQNWLRGQDHYCNHSCSWKRTLKFLAARHFLCKRKVTENLKTSKDDMRIHAPLESCICRHHP